MDIWVVNSLGLLFISCCWCSKVGVLWPCTLFSVLTIVYAGQKDLALVHFFKSFPKQFVLIYTFPFSPSLFSKRYIRLFSVYFFSCWLFIFFSVAVYMNSTFTYLFFFFISDSPNFHILMQVACYIPWHQHGYLNGWDGKCGVDQKFHSLEYIPLRPC